MVGTPGLGAVLRALETLGQIIDALEHNLGLYMALILLEHQTAEIILKVLADNEHHLAESGADSVKH